MASVFWNVTAPGTIFVVLSCTVLAEAVSIIKLKTTLFNWNIHCLSKWVKFFLPKVDSFISFNLIRSFRALSSSMLDLGPAPVSKIMSVPMAYTMKNYILILCFVTWSKSMEISITVDGVPPIGMVILSASWYHSWAWRARWSWWTWHWNVSSLGSRTC